MQKVPNKLYVFLDWAQWDHEIHECVVDFLQTQRSLPTILVANGRTFHQINMRVANSEQRDNIRNVEGSAPQDAEYPYLTAFSTGEYDLVFCMDDEMTFGTFRLVYDSAPVFDPDEDSDESEAEEFVDDPIAYDNVIPLIA